MFNLFKTKKVRNFIGGELPRERALKVRLELSLQAMCAYGEDGKVASIVVEKTLGSTSDTSVTAIKKELESIIVGSFEQFDNDLDTSILLSDSAHKNAKEGSAEV